MSPLITNADKRPLATQRLIPVDGTPTGKSSGSSSTAPQVLEGELIVAAAQSPPILVTTSFDSLPVYSRSAAIRYYATMQSLAAKPNALCDETV